MRKFLHCMNVSMLVVSMAYLTTACDDSNPEPVPEVEAMLSAELKSVTSTTAEITLSTERITEAASIAMKKGETAPDAAVIFATGTRGIACTDGENTVTVRNLEPLTDYVVYIAGLTDTEEYCKDIASVEVTTGDFEDEISVYDIDYDSFKLHLKVPESVSDPSEKHVIKWGLCDILTYKSNAFPDAMRLSMNDEVYGNYVTESTTFTFDNEHSYVLDDQGNPMMDEDIGDYLYYYDPLVPGGKYIATFGEFAWGEDMFGGWGEGYYVPQCDLDGLTQALWENPEAKEADYWTGFYQKVEVSTKAPEKLDASLGITKNLRPNGGQISFKPDEKIVRYLYCFMDDAMYNQLLQMFLDNDVNNMQWVMTSYWAMFNVGVMWAEEPTDVSLEEVFLYLDKEATYHLFAVGMGDERGTSQCFVHESFTLPDPTKQAPAVTVSAIDNPNGESSPYEVWFNVKCTTKDAFTGMYAANYEREWNSALSAGNELADLIESGNELTSDEIDKMNSDEGLNISFMSREDAVTYLGVIAYNDEGTASEPATASKRTISEPAATPVTSELFESLLGDWTATATVQYQAYNSEDFSHETKTEELKSKVTIGNVGYEEQLPGDVVDYYINNTQYNTKEQVDALYDKFKESVDAFNKKTKDQNRLLCQGLDLEIPQYGRTNTQYASPYDLFISETYSGYDAESPVWDFGPKWYLQIADDGSVKVPFNSNRFAPLSAWGQYEYYIIGVSETAALPYVLNSSGNPDNGYFPVTVSEDKDTLTVNALTYNGETYYPGMGYAYYGQWQLPSRIISPIKLTRGWSGGETKTSVYGAKASKIGSPAGMNSLYEVKTANKPKSRTVIPTAPTVEHRQVKAKITTINEFENNIESYRQKQHRKN